MPLSLDPAPGLNPDAVYARLLALGQNRTEAEARRALSALVLILINHVGDPGVIAAAFDLAEDLPVPQA